MPTKAIKPRRFSQGVMGSKPTRYYIKFPADAYALGPIKARTEREARQFAREFSGVFRLPRGFSCWPR